MSSVSAAETLLPLRARVLRAARWSLAGYGISQAIRFGSNLLMTRLLAPEMFGVMAIAFMLLAGLAMFSDVGLRQNVVQSERGSEAGFLNTAWTVQIARGVLIGLFAVGVSLLIFLANRFGMFPQHSVYALPNLPQVIAALSVIAVISGFDSTKLFEASRNLSLGRVTQIEILSQVVGLLCMVLWVAVDRSIWALVAGAVCSTLARTVLSHAWLPGIANAWRWEASAIREIMGLGKWIFAASILGFLVNHGDRLLLGGLLGAAELGVYVIAYLIFNAVELVLQRIIEGVAYPALSEVARLRPARLKASHYRVHVPIASFTYFCAGMLMVSGAEMIGLLYDKRYEQAGWMLEILAVALVTMPFRVAALSLLALGRARVNAELIAIRLLALFILVPVGFHLLGTHGAVWGIALSYFAALPTTVFHAIKLGLFDLRKELLALPAVLAGVLIGQALVSALNR